MKRAKKTARQASKPKPGSPSVIDLSKVKPRPIDWLWRNRLALGKPCVVAGRQGDGKSLLTVDIAARLSNATGWPDVPNDFRSPCGTLFLSAEDDPDDVLVPRLWAAGANCDYIRAMDGVFQGNGKKAGVSIRDVDAIGEAIESTPNCKVVVIDPIGAFVSNTDTHRDSDVRSVLMPMLAIAAEKRVALLLVLHLNKRGDGDAMTRVSGSIAWTALARTAYLVANDPDNSNRKLLASLKSNIARPAPTLAYSIQENTDEKPYVVWEPEPVHLTADDLVASGVMDSDERTERDDAADFLRELLLGGVRVPAAQVFKEAKAAGISERTLKRAKRDLGIKPEKEGFGDRGRWMWFWPKRDSEGWPPKGGSDPERKNVAPLRKRDPLSENCALAVVNGHTNGLDDGSNHKGGQAAHVGPFDDDGPMFTRPQGGGE